MHPTNLKKLEDPEHPVTRMVCGVQNIHEEETDANDIGLSACLKRVFSMTCNSGPFIELAFAAWDEPGPQREVVRQVMRLLYKLSKA